jgi:hypothetical protein
VRDPQFGASIESVADISRMCALMRQQADPSSGVASVAVVEYD